MTVQYISYIQYMKFIFKCNNYLGIEIVINKYFYSLQINNRANLLHYIYSDFKKSKIAGFCIEIVKGTNWLNLLFYSQIITK